MNSLLGLLMIQSRRGVPYVSLHRRWRKGNTNKPTDNTCQHLLKAQQMLGSK